MYILLAAAPSREARTLAFSGADSAALVVESLVCFESPYREERAASSLKGIEAALKAMGDIDEFVESPSWLEANEMAMELRDPSPPPPPPPPSPYLPDDEGVNGFGQQCCPTCGFPLQGQGAPDECDCR